MNIIKRKPKTNLQKQRNTVLNHWILQKVSAFVLIPLAVWFLFVFKDFYIITIMTKFYGLRVIQIAYY